jgi:hypothetical protein
MYSRLSCRRAAGITCGMGEETFCIIFGSTLFDLDQCGGKISTALYRRIGRKPFT